MPEKQLNSTLKDQIKLLCAQRIASGSAMRPVTTEEVAACVIRSILIEAGSEMACDIITRAEGAPQPSPEDSKAAKAFRVEMIEAVSSFFTASSNVDKYLRKNSYLPAKPDEKEAPEFS
ncbi:MAG: hypothetical protein KGL39_08565 [Patescibacteria group bacterium]|nr:hypothetical protein [Patescibacteria group bacterium]